MNFSFRKNIRRQTLCWLALAIGSCLISGNVRGQTSVLRIDSTLDVPFFHSPGKMYPKWVVLNKRGKPVQAGTGKRIDADTASLKSPATSFLMRDAGVLDHASPDTICSVESRALLRGDTLVILCAYQSTLSGEVLGITLSNELSAEVMDGYPKKENRIGQKAVFRHLALNKQTYRKGEELRAELDFYIEYDLNDVARGPYKQKVFYKGWIKCRVE